MKTRITELFGIEHPIIQGGMHYVGFAELASAVSNAGGLGIITGLTQKTPDDLRTEIARCRDILSRGTSAHRQLAIYTKAVHAGASNEEALRQVVDFLVEETARGI